MISIFKTLNIEELLTVCEVILVYLVWGKKNIIIMASYLQIKCLMFSWIFQKTCQ